MSKIYKYANYEAAFKIINEERVLLNPPSKFKDITDSTIYITKKTAGKTINLMENYGVFIGISEVFDSVYKDLKSFDKFIVRWYKFRLNILKKLLKKDKTYSSLPFMKTIYKVFACKLPSLDEIRKASEWKFYNDTIPYIQDIRSKARITCFSKSFDSMYCWNEHANGHNGVCIEYEEDRKFFKEVVYKNKNSDLDIYKATQKVLAHHFLKEELTFQDEQFANYILQPFYTKRLEYQPEEEIRCLLSDTESSHIGYICEKEKRFLHMVPKRVYIGCNIIDGQKTVELIKLCESKGIPISYMNFDISKGKVFAIKSPAEWKNIQKNP